MEMRIYFFLFLVFLLIPGSFLSAETTKESEDPFTEFLFTLTEVVFSDPFQKEEIEIRKRLIETNQAEIRNLRIRLKTSLRHHSIQKENISNGLKTDSEWVKDLEQFGNLGGLLWKDDRGTIFQWGDWSDFYEDGFSKNKNT